MRSNSFLLFAAALLASPLPGPSRADAEIPRTWVPTVRAGDRLGTAPLALAHGFTLPLDSKVREKGQYVLEFEGVGARDRIRLTLRRLDKPAADSSGPPQALVGTGAWALACSVDKLIDPEDHPGAIIDPQDRPRAIIEPNDRPRTFHELGFRANAAANARVVGKSIVVEIAGGPRQGVGSCVMKLTLEAGK